MATRKYTIEDLEKVTALARRWGKIVVREAFGEKGPGLDVDLGMMEEIAMAAVRGLAAGTLEEGTSQQAQKLGTEVPCPECGRPAPVEQETRPIVARGGPFEHAEPVCYCTRCRRSFFPSASAPEARRQRL